jgi:hypothetical protein
VHGCRGRHYVNPTPVIATVGGQFPPTAHSRLKIIDIWEGDGAIAEADDTVRVHHADVAYSTCVGLRPSRQRVARCGMSYAVTYPGGPASARGYDFEQFVQQILERSPDMRLASAPSPYGGDYGFDFAAVRKGQTLLIEVKVTTPQTSHRLEQMSAQLRAAADQYTELQPGTEPRLVLAIPGVLAESKRTLALRSRLEIWDGPHLSSWAGELGVPVPPYVATADRETDDEPAAVFEHGLLQRLHEIEPGQPGWSAYEKYCEDLLNFLFVPPLNPAIPQSRDERHANRRDYLLPNYALDGGWWQFMRSHYEAHYVVAEVKNLTGRPGKREILQVANYLNPHGTGLFAMIMARTGMDETARWICREQWVQHNKMIIGLDDEDVWQMVETKVAGNDPAELIRQKIEDFRLRI